MEYQISDADINVSPTMMLRHLANKTPHLPTEQVLAITKVFSTFQGEMPLSGQQAIFIRLAGCNRGAKQDCNWCDTSFQLDRASILEVSDLWDHFILPEINDTWPPDKSHRPLLVISGGEPGLQPTGIKAFLQYIIENYHTTSYRMPRIQFESNGDYLLDMRRKLFNNEDLMRAFEEYMYLVISPKAHQTAGYPHRMVEQVSSFMLDYTHMPEVFFRFVVSGEPSDQYYHLPPWIDELQAKLGNLLEGRIFVSPLAIYKGGTDHTKITNYWADSDQSNIDKERTQANYGRAAELAQQHHLRLSCQTHLLYAIE